MRGLKTCIAAIFIVAGIAGLVSDVRSNVPSAPAERPVRFAPPENVIFTVREAQYTDEGRAIWTCDGDPIVCTPEGGTPENRVSPHNYHITEGRYQQTDRVTDPVCIATVGDITAPQKEQPGNCTATEHFIPNHIWLKLDGSGTTVNSEFKENEQNACRMVAPEPR